MLIIYIEMFVKRSCCAFTSLWNYLTSSVITATSIFVTTVFIVTTVVMFVWMAIAVFKLVDGDETIIIFIAVIEKCTLHLFSFVFQMIIRSEFLLVHGLIRSKQELVEYTSGQDFTSFWIDTAT